VQYGKVAGVDKPVSRLVQGSVMINSKELDKSFALLDAVFELGCNTFDTAHGYGGGDSERTLGRWINARHLREKVVILDKGAHHNQDRRRVTTFDITSDLHDSLARLNTDYIDLYVLHRDDPNVPVGPIVEVLNEHLQGGRIHAFGGSNWTHQRLREANEYADAHGLVGMALSSPNFSLPEWIEEPWAECVSIGGAKGEGARKWYAQTQMPLFTWSSLGGGFCSGRFTRHNLDCFTEYLEKLCVKCYCSEENFKRLDRAAELGREKSLSASQIALGYVRSQALNIFPIVGSGSVQEFKENAAGSEVELSEQEMAYLDLRSDKR
jgi:aryl-alcohol dehydrogenase-like predicted oxidoreductase